MDLLYCHDGDTCRFIEERHQVINVRFWGVDAPELKQAGGKAAQQRVVALLTGQTITLRCKGKSYQRPVCDVWANNQSVNRILVREGFAWDSPQYSHGQYAADENHARQNRLGIWQGNPIPPWVWRKNQRHKKKR